MGFEVKARKLSFTYPQLEKMREPIEKMAAHFMHMALSGQNVVVKYDGDADGLSGALIIYRMFKCILRKEDEKIAFVQNTSPTYKAEDALHDLMHHPQAHYIFIDHANNDESEEGLSILRKSALSISIIDHHQSERKPINELVVTPSWYGLGFEYTAGYLCYEVARRVCDANYDDLWKVSLLADKSTLIFEKDEKLEKVALVLDYLTSTFKKDRHGIKFIDQLIQNDEMLLSVYLTAKDKLDGVSEVAVRSAKEKKLDNNLVLVTVNVDKVAERGEFPPRGKIVGRVHDWFCNLHKDEMVVTIGYGSDSASFRANLLARDRGFNANTLIQEMKKEYDKVLISGGGHPGAAAVRFRKGARKIVMDAFIDKISKLKFDV